MKAIGRVAQAVWSSASMFVTVGLFSMFIYWTVVQQAPLSYQVDGMQLAYTTTPGGTLYVENPLYPPDSKIQVRYTARLVSTTGGEKYTLTPSDSSMMFHHEGEKEFSHIRAGYPVYALSIPSYVKPDTYEYRVTAKYKLNVFRVEKMKLPAVRVVVK